MDRLQKSIAAILFGISFSNLHAIRVPLITIARAMVRTGLQQHAPGQAMQRYAHQLCSDVSQEAPPLERFATLLFEHAYALFQKEIMLNNGHSNASSYLNLASRINVEKSELQQLLREHKGTLLSPSISSATLLGYAPTTFPGHMHHKEIVQIVNDLLKAFDLERLRILN